MRTAKILGMVMGGLIGLVALGLLGVWLLVNPNNFKGKIERVVKESTGRTLILQGDIRLSVVPWIALELGPATLGNPPGFGATPLVAFRHAAVRVKLLPLLAKRLEIGRIELDGLDVRLQRNTQGRGNWQGFGSADTATVPDPSSNRNAGESLRRIEGISVRDARLSFEKLNIEKFNLEIGAFAEKGVVPVSLSFEADRGVATEHASVDAKLDLSIDSAQRRYRIAALVLNSAVNLADHERPIKWQTSIPLLELNTDTQVLAVRAWALNVAGAQLNGSLQGTHVVDDPALRGSFTLAPLVVREFLPRLGMTSPNTRDPKALLQMSMSSEFAYGGNALKLAHLVLVLDQTRLKGNVEIANLKTDALRFDLAVDHIDVDRYLGPVNRKPEGRAKPTPSPTEALRKLDLKGTVTGSVRFSNVDFTEVRATVLAKDGQLQLFPLQAKLYGGRYSGDIVVQSRDALPVVSMDEHLSGIDVARLLASGSKRAWLAGRGNVNIKATARGADADAILKSLSGRLDANLSDGAVEGVDLGYEVGRAQALLKKQPLPAGGNAKRTKFDVFKASAMISNGVAVTKDLNISSQVLRVTGQGSANLATKAIDYQITAAALQSSGRSSVEIPVRITGTSSDPTVRPDLEALAKGQLQQKLKDVLQDKLQGLFGKP